MACQSETAQPTAVFLTAVSPTAVSPIPASPTNTTLPSPTTPKTPTKNPPPAIDLVLTTNSVRLYPAPKIFAGDRVTFQLLPLIPQNISPEQVNAHIWVDGTTVAQGPLNSRNLYGTATGLFEWAWDTEGQMGQYTVEVALSLPDELAVQEVNLDNNQISTIVTVHDPAQLPRAEQTATWTVTENSCCRLHTIAGTAANRDLAYLLDLTETAVRQATRKLDESPANILDIYFIDKVIGQGGYAGNALVLSYPDRDYKGDSLYHVLVHEAAHVIDRQFAPQRITFLAEGTAVWASEGHYKTDDLHQRAAALLQTNQYIPLTNLVDDFYPAQHEVGYLQAAGFVTYLIDTYGWDQYKAFYSDVSEEDGTTIAAALNINLLQHYNLSLSEIERAWLTYLTTLDVSETAVTDLLTTIRYYDTMRLYQSIYDPAAYFLTAWLPHPQQVVAQGNIADLARHPQGDVNITLELMLQSADTALRAGDYNRANVLLDSTSRVLENDGVFIDPLANHYLNIVRVTANNGYEAQAVTLDGNEAIVIATRQGQITLTQFSFILRGQNWVLSS